MAVASQLIGQTLSKACIAYTVIGGKGIGTSRHHQQTRHEQDPAHLLSSIPDI
jgi:hypothetical protein